ncbi:cobalamin biosynthesis protein [Pseudomonas sp. SH1-B]
MMPSPAEHTTRPACALVAGLGCRRGCSLDELHSLLEHSLQQQGQTVDNLAALASISHKQEEAGLQQLAARLGLPITWLSPEQLAPYQTTPGSALTLAATGSPAVAEPCALALAARLGNNARLLADRTRSASATCALAQFDREPRA